MASGGSGTAHPCGEILRALGWQLDMWGWRQVRLDVRGPVVILDGLVPTRQPRQIERRILQIDDLSSYLSVAQHRGRVQESGWPPVPSNGTPDYQEELRLLGQHLERRDARLARAIEHTDGFIVQHLRTGLRDAGLATEILRWDALETLQVLMIRRRHRPPDQSMMCVDG